VQIIETSIPDVLIIEPTVFVDERGYFFESYNESKWPKSMPQKWLQDNESQSQKGVLRGLHYQSSPFGQAKLVRAILGEIYDVAVDIRTDSPYYGQWFGALLTSDNKRQMYIPKGFAHGFLVLSDTAIFGYKCDDYYSREHEGGIAFDDPSIGIEWPQLDCEFTLSDKDKKHPGFGFHKAY
jgi:dTDP-4-dehydrorhamnose 3,5-epimerase